MVHDFEIFEVADLKENIVELTKAYFHDGITSEDVSIGFIGASNKKTYVTTNQAYNSRFPHKYNELVLFIEGKKQKRLATKRKCTHTQNGM